MGGIVLCEGCDVAEGGGIVLCEGCDVTEGGGIVLCEGCDVAEGGGGVAGSTAIHLNSSHLLPTISSLALLTMHLHKSVGLYIIIKWGFSSIVVLPSSGHGF